MKLLIKSILIVIIMQLVACSVYQKRFGGTSSDYTNVDITKELQYPAGINALKSSDRYSIPEVKSSNKDCEIIDTVPPDYLK